MSPDWACSRCGRLEPRLAWPPWPGEAGQRIQNQICDICWREWMGMQTKIINEYRLNVLEPDHAKMLREQMLSFLGLSAPGSTPAMPTGPTG